MSRPTASDKPTKFDEEARQKFCDAIREHGSFRAASALVGVSPETARVYRRDDEEFREQYEIAYAEFCGNMEIQILRETVLEGIEEPIVGGKERDSIIGYKVIKSDRMRELFLKRHIDEFNPAQKVDMDVQRVGTVVVPKLPDMTEKEMEDYFNNGPGKPVTSSS